jgi:murein DD-endopeptidase MepM/ murein hydrolase activator NlpD
MMPVTAVTRRFELLIGDMAHLKPCLQLQALVRVSGNPLPERPRAFCAGPAGAASERNPMLSALRRPTLTRVMVTALLAVSAVGLPGSAAPAVAATLPAYHVQPGVVLRPKAPPLVLPVRGYRLTGRFGDRSGLWSSVHTGLDFAASYGAPIRSIGVGVVTATGYDGRYGNKTVVRLADGTELWFCHQSAVDVEVGEHVRPGQVIGAIGTTGNVTGPHLHLEVHPSGDGPVDPLSWLRARGVRP